VARVGREGAEEWYPLLLHFPFLLLPYFGSIKSNPPGSQKQPSLAVVGLGLGRSGCCWCRESCVGERRVRNGVFPACCLLTLLGRNYGNNKRGNFLPL
jgi:hypothetical protein